MAEEVHSACPRIVIMHKITIARKGSTPGSGFTAELSIDGGNCYEVAITNPFWKKQEAELEVYFEEWRRFPFTDTTVAERAAHSIKEYGTHLFNEILQTRDSKLITSSCWAS